MKNKILILLFLISFSITSKSAEYKGRNIDGVNYKCTAFSYATGKFYYLIVEFDGDEAILKFPKGGHITITLDDEEIEDPSSISAYDYQRGSFWELDIE